jgi:hypothetical protein
MLGLVVDRLDGHHGITDLYQCCPRDWVNWLLARLETHGMLAEGPLPRRRTRLKIEGEGVIADRLQALARAQHTIDTAASQPVTILCCSTVEADRVQVNELQRTGVAYLLVRASDDTARVGPFVSADSSCLTCTDLARRDLDPTWPVQVFQLATITTQPTPTLAAWASATAFAHAMAYARGLTPESTSTTIELSERTGRLTYRSWPVHPQCPNH